MKKRKENISYSKKMVIGLSALATGLLFSTIGLAVAYGLPNESTPTNNEDTSKKYSDFSVVLKEENYGGSIFRDSKEVNLSERVSKFPKFTGYTTNRDFTRMLDSVELRNGDMLEVHLPSDVSDNWKDRVRWVDSLSIDFPNQQLEFKKTGEGKWVSIKRISYVNTPDLPSEVRNEGGVCISKSMYESLSSELKEKLNLSVKNAFAYPLGDNPSKDSFDMSKLTDEQWKKLSNNGNGYNCYQIVNEGEVKVELNNQILTFTYDGKADYSFLGANFASYPRTMSYSYFSIRSDENSDLAMPQSWRINSGLLFSNINQTNYTTNTTLGTLEGSAKTVGGLSYKYDSEGNKFVASNWKQSLQEDNVLLENSFRAKNESIAALYMDDYPTNFSKWYFGF